MEASGATPFTLVTITGAECPFEANKETVAGSEAFQSVNEIGNEQIKQPVTNLTATDKAMAPGLKTQLFYGASKAELTGELIAELAGANTGKVWGAK